MIGSSLKETSAWLVERAGEKDFVAFLEKLLVELCGLPSIPGADLARTAQEEGRVYERISAALRERALSGTASTMPISAEISRHKSFTYPYYAGTVDAHRGRSNLVHVFSPAGTVAPGRSVALNAHIDTVGPFLEPRVENGTVFGRGACDDKGGCAAIVGALALLRELAERGGIEPRGRIVSMFVTDEETGGNGSLALAMDRELGKNYDTVIVVESTEGKLHPANRGAVWYKTDFPGRSPQRLRVVMEVVRELERAGRTLKEESAHPLFPDRPVQTCHGVLGRFGEHPSAICGMVSFSVRAPLDKAAVRRAIEPGLAQYIEQYGDKTKRVDPRSGQPKVKRHYDLEERKNDLLLTVWGSGGHMGSIPENDGAITKAAFMLAGAWERVPAFDVRLESDEDPDPLVLEGGQGFLPTHQIEEVESRIREAVQRAYRGSCDRFGYTGGAPMVSFDKLHNDAFDGEPDSQAMRHGLRAARLAGIPVELPVKGLKVSCDARLFAREYPHKPVITVGPGSLEVAHGDGECMELAELARSSAFLALYLLLLTGAVDGAGE
jgi:acetylornithine deacetylase/succinyl-diaminopimelate desuccinylase-like protein